MQDWMIKLERAKKLLDAGALTPEEFEAEKARLMPKASMTYVEHSQHQVAEPLEDQAAPAFGWSKLAGSIALLIAAASIVFLLLSGQSPAPSPVVPQNDLPQPSPAAPPSTPTPVAPPTFVPAPAAAEFGCIGAYSNVSFSEESGDGSGLFVSIAESGHITWKYYEGSISLGNVTVKKRSADSISATVRYVDYPSEPSSSVVLKCKNGRLSAVSANIGNLSLRKLTATEAAELDI